MEERDIRRGRKAIRRFIAEYQGPRPLVLTPEGVVAEKLVKSQGVAIEALDDLAAFGPCAPVLEHVAPFRYVPRRELAHHAAAQ